MKRRTQILSIIAAVAAFIFFASTKGRMTGGEGQVFNYLTRKPIENALVTLECRKHNFFHGSRKIKDINVKTDKNGNYRFSSQNVFRCDFAYVSAKKDGMEQAESVDVRFRRTDYENIPERISLLPVSELNMQRLKYLYELDSGSSSTFKIVELSKEDRDRIIARKGYVGSINEAKYQSAFSAFLESSKIMSTKREMQYVREKYCNWLNTLHSELTSQEIKYLSTMGAHPLYRERIDHNIAVNICKKLVHL